MPAAGYDSVPVAVRPAQHRLATGSHSPAGGRQHRPVRASSPYAQNAGGSFGAGTASAAGLPPTAVSLPAAGGLPQTASSSMRQGVAMLGSWNQPTAGVSPGRGAHQPLQYGSSPSLAHMVRRQATPTKPGPTLVDVTVTPAAAPVRGSTPVSVAQRGQLASPVRGADPLNASTASPSMGPPRGLRTPLSPTRPGSRSQTPEASGFETMRGSAMIQRSPTPEANGFETMRASASQPAPGAATSSGALPLAAAAGAPFLWATPRQAGAQAAVESRGTPPPVRSASPWRGAVASSGSLHLWTHPARQPVPAQLSPQPALQATTARSANTVAPGLMSPSRSGRSHDFSPVQQLPMVREPSEHHLLSALVPKDLQAEQDQEYEAQLVAKLRNELAESYSEEATLEATIAQKRSHAVMQGSWIETLKKRIDSIRQRKDADHELPSGLNKVGAQQGVPGDHTSRLQWGTDLGAAKVKGGGAARKAGGEDPGDSVTFPETAGWEENENQVEQEDEDLDTEEFSLEAAKAQISNLKDLRRQVSHLEDELASRIAEIAQLGLQLHEFRAFASEGSPLRAA